MVRKGHKSSKSHKKSKRMRGGSVLGVDVKGLVTTFAKGLIDKGGKVVNVIKKISDNMATGSKPSDLMRGLKDQKPTSSSTVNSAFAEAMEGLADGLKDKGMGYRRKGKKSKSKKMKGGRGSTYRPYRG